MTTSAASMLLDLAPALSSLNISTSASAAARKPASLNSSVSFRGNWNGLRAGGVQVGGASTWRSLKKELGVRVRVCAVAELFESEVLGTDEEEGSAEEAPVKTVKPKTGKRALILKSDRVS